jgi:A118 family predicted phage portal protein
VDRLLIGRFKNPTINRADLNSDQGVPITYGNDVAIENAKKSYEIFNKELKKKQTKLFVSKQLLKKDTEGNTTLTDDGFYQLLKSDLDGNLPIKEFAPDFRYEQLKGFVDYNFKMLEMFCGFSTGLLSDVDMNMVTATAIRSSLISTYAFITSMRDIIEQGMTDYTYAIEMLLNANESYIPTNYTIKFDWDDSIMESSTERFNQLLQAKGLNAITTAELRAWTMGESEEVAEQKIIEMETTAATDTNNQLEL